MVLKSFVAKGIEGIASVVYDNIADIIGDENIFLSFAHDTPEVFVESGCSYNCSAWYGIVKDRTRDFFASPNKETLYLDYFGGCIAPQVIVLDDLSDGAQCVADITHAIREIFASIEGDYFSVNDERLFYCELEKTELAKE